jgi:hypothetical protein
MMSTLDEIEAAAQALPQDQQRKLFEWLGARLAEPQSPTRRHSILDLAPISVGKIIHLPGTEDDLLGEMLEDRQ